MQTYNISREWSPSQPQQKPLSVHVATALTWVRSESASEGQRLMDGAITPARCSLARLSAAELSVVHRFAQTARPGFGRSSAIALSRLGNFWVYPALALGSIVAAGTRALPVLVIGLLNAVVLHSVYPLIKRRVARPRPYQRDATLVALLPVMDQHSFPSGHAMTLPAALVPLVLVFPQTLGLAYATWLLIAWARLASAHHYPSDVAVGAALGVSVSYPMSHFGLAALRLVF
jgi:membrane-associated phospholipid phosphatase